MRFSLLQNLNIFKIIFHYFFNIRNNIIACVSIGHVISEWFKSPRVSISPNVSNDTSSTNTVFVIWKIKSTKFFLRFWINNSDIRMFYIIKLFPLRIYCDYWPNGLYLGRYLWQVNADCFIVTISFSSSIIATVNYCAVVSLFLHKAAHVMVVSLKVKLEDRAINITACFPSQANFKIGYLFW